MQSRSPGLLSLPSQQMHIIKELLRFLQISIQSVTLIYCDEKLDLRQSDGNVQSVTGISILLVLFHHCFLVMNCTVHDTTRHDTTRHKTVQLIKYNISPAYKETKFPKRWGKITSKVGITLLPEPTLLGAVTSL